MNTNQGDQIIYRGSWDTFDSERGGYYLHQDLMKHIINSISAGTEWPMVMWIHLGETSGNSRDLRGLKGHVRAISRDETIQPFRILSLSWKGFPWVQSLLIFTTAWWERCYYIHIRDKEGLESEFKMSPQPELRRTDSSTLPSLIPDTNWKLCNVDCIHTLTAVDQGSDPWCSASSVTLADLHDRSIVGKGAYVYAPLVMHLALS